MQDRISAGFVFNGRGLRDGHDEQRAVCCLRNRPVLAAPHREHYENRGDYTPGDSAAAADSR